MIRLQTVRIGLSLMELTAPRLAVLLRQALCLWCAQNWEDTAGNLCKHCQSSVTKLLIR